MIVLDVRQPDEFSASHVEGAINIPHDELQNYTEVPKKLRSAASDEAIYVYCNSGNRAGQAKQELERLGFSNVHNTINESQTQNKYNN